jgi:hypothetical protein
MFKICFWSEYQGWREIGKVAGDEAAYVAYRAACALAEALGEICALIDAETGEIIAESENED